MGSLKLGPGHCAKTLKTRDQIIFFASINSYANKRFYDIATHLDQKSHSLPRFHNSLLFASTNESQWKWFSSSFLEAKIQGLEIYFTLTALNRNYFITLNNLDLPKLPIKFFMKPFTFDDIISILI